MMWHWPQYTICALLVFSAFGGAMLDGQPRTGKHNGALVCFFMAAEAWILHMGGFW